MADKKITVFRGSAPSNSYVWSPFVTKLEARLRFANIPYALGAGTPRTAPRGKIPYVEHEGQLIGDSTLIIKHLLAHGVIPTGDADGLTPGDRARDLAVRALLEDKLYFYGTREKWCDNYQTMIAGVLAAVPWFVRPLVGMLVYSKVSRTLDGQGTGLLSEEEVAMFKEEAWEALNALLSEAKATSLRNRQDRRDEREDEQPFWVLGGETPTEGDATLYGFVVGALICDA